MRWYKDLYTCDDLTGSIKYIQFVVEHGFFGARLIYLITLSKFCDGQLEIVPAVTKKTPFFRKNSQDVIGVAKGYYHARSLVEKIYQDVYDATGSCEVKEYFRQRFEEQYSAK